MTDWKYNIGVGLLLAAILLIMSLITSFIIYPLMTGESGFLNSNWLPPVIIGLLFPMIYQKGYSKLRGSSDVKKGIILTGEVWVILTIIGLFFMVIIYHNLDIPLSLPYLVLALFFSLITYIFIGFIIGAIWEKLHPPTSVSKV